MDIDSEHLGIPKTEYNCMITVRGDIVALLHCSLCNGLFSSDRDALVCVFGPCSSLKGWELWGMFQFRLFHKSSDVKC